MVFLTAMQVWAYGGSLLGMWLSGRQNPIGPLLGAIGFIPWAVIGFHAGLPLMIAFSAILGALNLRAYLIWRGPRPASPERTRRDVHKHTVHACPGAGGGQNLQEIPTGRTVTGESLLPYATSGLLWSCL